MSLLDAWVEDCWAKILKDADFFYTVTADDQRVLLAHGLGVLQPENSHARIKRIGRGWD